MCNFSEMFSLPIQQYTVGMMQFNVIPTDNKTVLHLHNFFLIVVCEAIGTAATPGLLCQPRVIVKMIVETQMECRLAEETEVLGETLPQRHFRPSQNPT
jgi:hypothetical protein